MKLYIIIFETCALDETLCTFSYLYLLAFIYSLPSITINAFHSGLNFTKDQDPILEGYNIYFAGSCYVVSGNNVIAPVSQMDSCQVFPLDSQFSLIQNLLLSP